MSGDIGSQLRYLRKAGMVLDAKMVLLIELNGGNDAADLFRGSARLPTEGGFERRERAFRARNRVGLCLCLYRFANFRKDREHHGDHRISLGCGRLSIAT